VIPSESFFFCRPVDPAVARSTTGMSNNRFVWFTYLTTDASKAHGFFGELFHWGMRSVPMGPGREVAMITVGERTIGSYDAPPASGARWLPYLGVRDLAAATRQVTALGGTVVAPASKVGEFGTETQVADPLGGALALWQSADLDAPEPAPAVHTFCWNELFTADPERSLAFYQGVGGFDHEVMPSLAGGTAYHLLKSGGSPRAGLMKRMHDGMPQAWIPYVAVASADQTAARAQKLGATVHVPPSDIPNVGRFSIFADPQGASLGILQAS
jgi:uncharacterized protein